MPDSRFFANEPPDLEVLRKEYQRLTDFCFYTALKIVKDPNVAADIAQEAMIKYVVNFKSLVERGINPLGWLTRVVVNLCMDHFDRCSREREILSRYAVLSWSAATASPPDKEAVAVEDRAALLKAVYDLPEEQSTVIIMYDFCDMSYAEIASDLNIPEGTARTRRYYGLLKLEQVLGPDFPEWMRET